MIYFLDRGGDGLLYPKEDFIKFLRSLADFILSELPLIKDNSIKLKASLYAKVLPECNEIDCLKCGCSNVTHTEIIKKLIIDRFIKVLVQNYAKTITGNDKKKMMLQIIPTKKQWKKIS